MYFTLESAQTSEYWQILPENYCELSTVYNRLSDTMGYSHRRVCRSQPTRWLHQWQTAYKMAPPMAGPAWGSMEEGKQGRGDGQGTWRPANTGANIAMGFWGLRLHSQEGQYWNCNWEYLYYDSSRDIRLNIAWALRKSLGLCPWDFLWAKAIFHCISLLSSQYGYILSTCRTIYWDLTLPVCVLQLCNIVYDTP